MFKVALPAKAWITMAPAAFNSAAAALLLASTGLLASTPLANAATISIGYELPSFTPGTITMVGHEVNPVYGTVSVTGFGANTWTATAVGNAPTTTHLVGDVHTNVGDPNVMNSFSVYITMSDIPFQVGDINPVTIINDMHASWTGPSMDGWILNFTTYINPTNGIFDKQIYLNGGPIVFDPATTETTRNYVGSYPYLIPGQTPFADLIPGQKYSVTQFYGFVAPSPPAHTPGPIVGAGIPGLVTGMLGLLVWARGRRQRQQS
jgi:hypothetical protein